MKHNPIIKKFKEISCHQDSNFPFLPNLKLLVSHIICHLELPPEFANSIKVQLDKLVLFKAGSHYKKDFQPSQPSNLNFYRQFD